MARYTQIESQLLAKRYVKNNEGKEIKNFDVIHPLDAPYDAQGGLIYLIW